MVGSQHHAARVLHFHPQRHMSPLRPENKGGDQHGPAHGDSVTSGAVWPVQLQGACSGGCQGRPEKPPRPRDSPISKDLKTRPQVPLRVGGWEPGERGGRWGAAGQGEERIGDRGGGIPVSRKLETCCDPSGLRLAALAVFLALFLLPFLFLFSSPTPPPTTKWGRLIP